MTSLIEDFDKECFGLARAEQDGVTEAETPDEPAHRTEVGRRVRDAHHM